MPIIFYVGKLFSCTNINNRPFNRLADRGKSSLNLLICKAKQANIVLPQKFRPRIIIEAHVFLEMLTSVHLNSKAQ